MDGPSHRERAGYPAGWLPQYSTKYIGSVLSYKICPIGYYMILYYKKILGT